MGYSKSGAHLKTLTYCSGYESKKVEKHCTRNQKNQNTDFPQITYFLCIVSHIVERVPIIIAVLQH